MKRIVSIAMFLILALLCGCSSVHRDPVTSRLNWSVSAAKAYTYTLDGTPVGDYASLKKHIAGLPSGSTLLVGPYHEARGYHFDELDLRKHCERYGVRFGIPKTE